MTATTKQLGLVALLAAGMALNANALLLTPATATWQGSLPKNPDADALETITGTSEQLTLMYKNDAGVGEEGALAGSYQTTFANTATDPQNATITYTGGQYIGGTPIYLLVKGGNSDPVWYVFDISGWDGTETIQLEGFWPLQGAISQISTFGDGTRVSDGGSTLMLLGLAVTSLGLLRRKLPIA